MDLVGIENENGYFPEGFFADSLDGEISDAATRWQASDIPSPIERLVDDAPNILRAFERFRATNEKDVRRQRRAELSRSLVEAMGYDYRRQTLEIDGGQVVPSLARVPGPDGRDLVWILEAPDATDDPSADPLSLRFEKAQFPAEEYDAAELERPLEELLAEAIFSLDHPPQFVLVIGFAQLALVRRSKWAERAALRFDLIEIFDRRERGTLATMACFASREAVAPETGTPLMDRLEEEAQRRANAVTTSLKATVRDAIEILGQEVLDVSGGKYPPGHPRAGVWIRGDDLTKECLRHMYRLLFLFYAEANPKLGVLDMKNPVYASGYSLEALRAHETKKLTTHVAREGTFLWESLERLLHLMFEGTELRHKKAFHLRGARVQLLDPRATPILANVKLRNQAVQKIIRLLSLKRTRSGTGRISYAQLGIGQLGAVYETLISFTGFVAKEDLIEIRPGEGEPDTDDAPEPDADDLFDEDKAAATGGATLRDEDLLKPSWFVPRRRAREFPVAQVIYDGPNPRIYEKGSFIYRLAGRDREKTAAYYTPEPLARLLVKHTLMERCKDLSADDLLELTILEPAMGSAAFIAETVNQLADLYLERKQEETGRTIPQEQYFLERQKVRAYISDRNAFGVDLNPIATELAAISLWLNSLHAGDFSPWFGDQLHAGSSLIGARRATYPVDSLKARGGASWLNILPTEVGWRGTREARHVWHFLVPAPGMSPFEGEKSIKAFAGPAQAAIKAWRRDGWEKPFTKSEIALVERLSAVVDDLFEAAANDLKRARELCNDPITLWPDNHRPGAEGEDFVSKRHRMAVLRGERHLDDTVPYRRLKAAMDAWCALWMWPLDKTHLLPSRTQFLHDMTVLLQGGYLGGEDEEDDAPEEQRDLFDIFDDGEAETLVKDLPSGQQALFAATDVEGYMAETAWLSVARDVAARERFVHYDLFFADVLRARGGFDLIVGNPPWAKPSWNEGLVLADLDPIHAGLTASQAKDVLAEALAKAPAQERRGRAMTAAEAFLEDFASTRGAMAVTSSGVMHPFAGGGSNNLYRCFVDLSFRLLAPEGNAGFVHQQGFLGDPQSGEFRRHWYGRIQKHFHFRNEIKSKNFAEIGNRVEFSLNVYRGGVADVNFEFFCNAFLASQVEDSYQHDGTGQTPDIKTPDGQWDTRGHLKRILKIDRIALAGIAALSEEDDGPAEEARFIQPFSTNMLEVFRQLARFPKLDAAIPRVTREVETASGWRNVEIALWQMSACWNETAAQNDGTIKRHTGFRDADDMVLQGPLFYVGNPVYKTPKRVCNTHKAFDPIDLLDVPEDYLPRTNYGPAIDRDEYRARMTQCRWDPTKKHTDFYRVAFRRQLALNGERTLISALLPPGAGHVDGIESIAIADEKEAVNLAALSASTSFDFLTKASGGSDLRESHAARLPWVALGPSAHHRILRLACLTTAYADLWNRHAPTLTPAPWSSDDPRLDLDGPVEGPTTWDRSAGLRTEFARRMALVEIDVLVAQALGLTLEQLIEIYRIYFPVLQENEAGTWYDQQGRIVWTCSKGLPGVGYLEKNRQGVWKSPGRSAWERLLATDPPELTCEATDDTQPGGPRTVTRRFVGPFTTCDRVEDYRRAWAHFERLRADGVDV